MTRLNKASPAAAPDAQVPQLREDLRLFPAASNQDGSPAWMIHDPIGNRFFRIGWLEFEMLSRWHLRTVPAIAASVMTQTPLPIAPEHFTHLIEFLRSQQLLRISDKSGTNFLNAILKNQTATAINKLLHNYLFFRLPLVRPGDFLRATLPFINFIYSKAFFLFTLFCTFLGIVLAARQWDTFVHTFSDFLSPQGMAGYGVALILAKTLHELGHAYTCTRYGVRVAHMGFAFLVMWPMLYTDTGESWKLDDRRQRFNIAAAGICAEFALAGFATLAWSLTQDGSLRSALFFLATTSWIITVGINASPFMRFDGYFLLSDALDIPNLHARSGALARVWVRRHLLGFKDTWPETLPTKQRRLLITFALITWLYRLTVFIGIAAAVYYLFFKALGIFLFLIEIVWFILKPIWGELKVWKNRINEISKKARLGWLISFGLIALVLAVPWRSNVHAQALLRSDQQVLIYSPVPAKIASLRPAGPIKAGEAIAELDSPDTRSRANQAAIIAQALARQLDQTIGRDEGLDARASIREQLNERLAEVQAQKAELARLQLNANFDGVLMDTDPLIRPGVWVNGTQPLAVLIDPTHWVVEALVEQADLARVQVGNTAYFQVRGQADQRFEGTVLSIDTARLQTLPHVMLSTDHGGRVASLHSNSGSTSSALVPRDSLYRVKLKLKQAPRAQSAVIAGSVVINGASHSILSEWGTGLAALFVRESGF